jgi:catechol 2,3-dioxygenase-like lactoylglutathione lyase family enzyme
MSKFLPVKDVGFVAIAVQVVFDCQDPDRLAHFWAEVLGYELDPPPPGYDSWEAWLTEQGIPESEWNSASAVSDPDGRGPRIYFQRVPELKERKNRVHLDVNAGGGRGTPDDERRAAVDSAADRAIAIGATKVRLVEERGQRQYVMQDPEGNEFCIQ